jgi:hypothetical protein
MFASSVTGVAVERDTMPCFVADEFGGVAVVAALGESESRGVLGVRIHQHLTPLPIDENTCAVGYRVEQVAQASDRRDAKRARQNRRVTRWSAVFEDQRCDVRTVEVQGVRGQELLRDQHRPWWKVLQHFRRPVSHGAEQSVLDIHDVVSALTDVLVLDCCQLLYQDVRFLIQRELGVDSRLGDAPLNLHDEIAVFEQRKVRSKDFRFGLTDFG